jgi:hypothetical protein
MNKGEETMAQADKDLLKNMVNNQIRKQELDKNVVENIKKQHEAAIAEAERIRAETAKRRLNK